ARNGPEPNPVSDFLRLKPESRPHTARWEVRPRGHSDRSSPTKGPMHETLALPGRIDRRRPHSQGGLTGRSLGRDRHDSWKRDSVPDRFLRGRAKLHGNAFRRRPEGHLHRRAAQNGTLVVNFGHYLTRLTATPK